MSATRQSMDETSNRVRAALRVLVKKHGSQNKAAKAIGITQAHLSHVLSGSNVGLHTVVAVARAAGMSVDALLFGSTHAR